MKKPETNTAFVKRIMSDDLFKQMFVIAALDVYARQVLATEPMEHGFIDGVAWKKCAESVLSDLSARK